MKPFLLSALSIAALLGLSGCPSIPSPPPFPFTAGEHNVLVHTYSGVEFPEQIGPFTREGTRAYDQSGSDVSAAYNCRTPVQVTATVYAFPSPKLTSIGSPAAVVHSAREQLTTRYFNEIKQTILRSHPNAVQTQSKDLAGPESTIGKYAEYKLNEPFFGRKQDLTSRLYLFTYLGGKWTVEYRFTYPSGAMADTAVDEFVKAYHWTVNAKSQP